jgi:hypothetical protein
MSQIHEEDSDISSNDSLVEQSHFQSRKAQGEKYSFATSRLVLKHHFLLDNQSSVHVFCNPDYVTDIRRAEWAMQLKSNGGKLPINYIANYEGFAEAVWFSKDAITNVLSLARLKQEYRVSYDGEDFIVHCASNGYSDMVFVPHKSGLHVYNSQDPRGLASSPSLRQWRGTCQCLLRSKLKKLTWIGISTQVSHTHISQIINGYCKQITFKVVL